MLKFLSKLLLPLSLLILILLLPPKISAQACSEFFPLGGNSNICSNQACEVAVLGKNCEQPSLGCRRNPFCKKYTGTECCVQGRRYDFCRQTFFNPQFACPANLPNNGFTCCFNPTPTPIPPTPTPGPTATPTPAPTITPIP